MEDIGWGRGLRFRSRKGLVQALIFRVCFGLRILWCGNSGGLVQIVGDHPSFHSHAHSELVIQLLFSQNLVSHISLTFAGKWPVCCIVIKQHHLQEKVGKFG